MDWGTTLRGTGLQAFVEGNFVPYDVAIVVPGMNVTEDSGNPWSEESRRARDANLTASLRNQSRRQRGRMAVFGQPDPSVQSAHCESVTDIAEVIARGALEANPLPRDDALAVFAAAVKFAGYVHDLGDGIPVGDLWENRVRDRMLELRSSLVEKYTDEAELTIARRSLRYVVFSERAIEEVANRAMAEYRREFDAMPAQLRSMARDESISQDLRRIHSELVSRLSPLVKAAEVKSRRESEMNQWARQVIELLGNNPA
jgi:hypothetical protein